ncbi:hypothetical protein IQ62_01620 [Streptomyces scabiei]|uniref:hypothetical protein n=1 Tax=Streptomyces scabiei TaxID=1930 RepID=UPI0004E64EF7|nr:hypothetical protein [Streptomyces scabiei]KFG02501.1 hypothetical protein IQ62_01620 [Streptomyces scabiei]
MKRHHAVEILLTRPLSPGELKSASRSVPLAVNADRTCLMALQRASSPGNALHRLRRRLEGRLPIDVLSTHYADRDGQVRLNVAFSRSDMAAIRRAAAARGQRSAELLSRRVTAAVAARERDRLRALENRLEVLLADHTLDDVLICAGRALSRHRRTPC